MSNTKTAMFAKQLKRLIKKYGREDGVLTYFNQYGKSDEAIEASRQVL